jgi:hypothetical protein
MHLRVANGTKKDITELGFTSTCCMCQVGRNMIMCWWGSFIGRGPVEITQVTLDNAGCVKERDTER